MVHGMALAAQDSLKCQSEFWTEDGVDDGIESGVEVAQPQEERYKGVVKLVVLEYGHHQGKNEEGQPAGYECPSHYGQGLGSLPLPFGL